MVHQSKSKNSRLSWPILLLFLLSVWAWIVNSNLGRQRPSVDPNSSILSAALDAFKGQVDPAKPPNKPHPEYHVIFSTGCSLQQHWESYVLFYHAYKVHQPGNVTRLVAGCTPREEQELRIFHQEKIRTMSDRFHVFFTRNFGGGPDFHGDYKYNNKPNSVYLWMKDILGMGQERNQTLKDVENGIILLLDPDMILLRPLLHDFTGQEMIYASAKKEGASHPKKGLWRMVQHGMPMAQQDGYLSNEWMNFNVSYITQGGSFPSFGKHDGPLYWNSGPPYLSTVRDMWSMVSLWKDYVPRVYKEYPQLFAEMYGLIISAVHLNLSHTLVKSIVVSEVDTEREGWKFVDAMPDDQVCQVEQWSNNPRMPVILHYCGRYALGKFFFSKYRLKKNYISCETPLLTMPPSNAHQIFNYWARPPPDRGQTHEMTVENVTAKQAKRQAFMLCGLIHSVNEAARYYKRNHCNGTGNFSEIYNFHDDPYST